MQKNRCAICLEPVKFDTDTLQRNDSIMCVHYSSLNKIQVGQRITAQKAYQDNHQSNEHETFCNNSFLRLSRKPAFRKLPPFKHSVTPEYTPERYNKIIYPVQEYSVDSTSSKSCSRTQHNNQRCGSMKWFSSMRKLSYRIMPLSLLNKYQHRKDQRYGVSQNKQGEETIVFPFTTDASDVYSSEILDWLGTQSNNEALHSLPESVVPQSAPSGQYKKKVTIQDNRDPYLTAHRNHDYHKLLKKRGYRRKGGVPTVNIGSQYSNHSPKVNAADFMDWVTSAPKIPKGNMLILLDCRNKKDTKNIGIQPSFNDPQRCTGRSTAASLILDLLEGRTIQDHSGYYLNCLPGQGSSITLVKTCTTENRIMTSLKKRDDYNDISKTEELYPETVEEKVHHVVSIVFSRLSHFSDLLGRLTKVVKDEFTYGDKNVHLDKKSKV